MAFRMSRPFTRTSAGVRVRLRRDHALVVLTLVTDLVALLSEEAVASPDAPPPDPLEELTGLSSRRRESPSDPVLRRLLPDGFGVPGADRFREESAEFRRYTEGELRRGKLDRARAVAEELQMLQDGVTPDGKDLVLDAAGVERWLTVLNDLRLAMGELLAPFLDPATTERLAADDPRAPIVGVYDLLTWLQSVLLDAAPV
jgi:hypothetical protein